MKGKLLNIAILLLFITYFSNCNQSDSNENSDIIEIESIKEPNTPFGLTFELLDETAIIKNSYDDFNQFSAFIEFKNKSHDTIEVYPKIDFGMKRGGEAFFVEAFDLNNNEVDIDGSADYQKLIHIDIERIKFSIGDVIIDSLYSSFYYNIKEKGIYKLRFVFDPDKIHNMHGELISDKIYSNWDTITIN